MSTKKPLSGDEEDICPNCGNDLTGKPIPQEYIDRGLYGKPPNNKTHYSRRIGLYDRERDRTSHWRCPDCNHTWSR